ncbi:ankyrin repeat-containing domain protein [Pyronema domesticum]|nr:ankyrin repeat-containing domain protein [Pyronema domesticum]
MAPHFPTEILQMIGEYITAPGTLASLCLASRSFNQVFTEYLWKRAATLSEDYPNTHSPHLDAAQWALELNNVRLVERLLHYGLSPDTVLNRALRRGDGEFFHRPVSMSNHLTIIRLILEAGAKVDAVDEAGMTPLHIICAFPVQGCVELAKLLIKHGAKVDVTDDRGRTPLHHVCDFKYGQTESMGCVPGLVKLLLQNDASIDGVDGEGNSARGLAVVSHEHGAPYALLAIHEYNGPMVATALSWVVRNVLYYTWEQLAGAELGF